MFFFISCSPRGLFVSFIEMLYPCNLLIKQTVIYLCLLQHSMPTVKNMESYKKKNLKTYRFTFIYLFFVPPADKYAMECPCVPVAKNTCYVCEHVSICMIAIRRQYIACPLLFFVTTFSGRHFFPRSEPNHLAKKSEGRFREF